MELNSLIFPAPKCSYTIDSNNLLWIESHPENTPIYHLTAIRTKADIDRKNAEKENGANKGPLSSCFRSTIDKNSEILFDQKATITTPLKHSKGVTTINCSSCLQGQQCRIHNYKREPLKSLSMKQQSTQIEESSRKRNQSQDQEESIVKNQTKPSLDACNDENNKDDILPKQDLEEKTKQISETIDKTEQIQQLPSAECPKQNLDCLTISNESNLGEKAKQQHSPTKNDELRHLSPKSTNRQKFKENIQENSPLKRAAELGPELKNVNLSNIPCLFLPFYEGSNKLLIYFHGNAEDLGYSYEFSSTLRTKLKVNVLVVEYPGYGLYKGSSNADQILADADSVYEFARQKMKVPATDIILFGRSIGSGPACYLAGTRNIGGLVLMCPYTSIRNAAKHLAGGIASYLIAERFRNIDCIQTVKAPTLFIHGKQDKLIPYQHSLELMEHIKEQSLIHLSSQMTHNDFDMQKDLLAPLKNFFIFAKVVIENKRITIPSQNKNKPF